MKKQAYTMILILLLSGCSILRTQEKSEVKPFAYIYDFDDSALKTSLVYEGDFDYLEIPYFSQRKALPVMGKYCKDPATSQYEISCTVLENNLPYFDISKIFECVDGKMMVMTLDEGGNETGENVFYEDTLFFLLLKNHTVIPIPSIYTQLRPHFRGNEFGFIDEIPTYEILDSYVLKTSKKYDLIFSIIEIEEGYILEVNYIYTSYPKPTTGEKIVAYGFVEKNDSSQK